MRQLRQSKVKQFFQVESRELGTAAHVFSNYSMYILRALGRTLNKPTDLSYLLFWIAFYKAPTASFGHMTQLKFTVKFFYKKGGN